MLSIDPKLRPSSQSILKHDWLSNWLGFFKIDYDLFYQILIKPLLNVGFFTTWWNPDVKWKDGLLLIFCPPLLWPEL
jgi:serine/threonine protein kinase